MDKNLTIVNEVTLNRVLSKHFTDGFIIITADRSEITDASERNARYKQLKTDVSNAGYPYIPVYGGYKETNPDTGEKYDATSFERGLLIPNQRPFNGNSREDDNLVELGKKLAKKYQQESFLYKPKGESKESFWIDANGNITNKFNGLSVNDITQEFFTKLFHSKNPQKADRRLTMLPEIYMHKAPSNANEAYQRFGEQFFKF